VLFSVLILKISKFSIESIKLNFYKGLLENFLHGIDILCDRSFKLSAESWSLRVSETGNWSKICRPS